MRSPAAVTVFGIIGLGWSGHASAGCEALQMAAMAGDMPQLAAQLRSGVSADCKDVKGQTALFYALSYQQTGVIEFLLARGAHINIRDNAGETLLREAEDAAFMAKTSGLGQKSADELVTLIKAHGGTR